MKADTVEAAVAAKEPVPISPRVHWIGALDPTLRSFDIILKTANGTSYNAYAVRGSAGVAVVDTVKGQFSGDFFTRLEKVARYDEIKAIVLNHLEPDHTGGPAGIDGALPQCQAVYLLQGSNDVESLVETGKHGIHAGQYRPFHRLGRPHAGIPAYPVSALAGHAMHLFEGR
jgi:flavorubredoxin